MRYSLGTRIETDGMNTSNGYGYATEMMLKSMRNLGYSIEDNAVNADVEIWFDQPHHWKFQKGAYKIGYHPWESTELLPGWVEIMNKCDEIWTPSPLIAQWYTKAGVYAPVYVYEHGIDHVWSQKPREPAETINFLHVGAEATRKGGWDTMRLFRKAFPQRDDVRLTLKIINSDWAGIENVGRTHIINKKYSFAQLQELFYSHHAYVYPSWGEGFGLTPLQAMATGMPTICTEAWAPYRRFFDPNLTLGSKLSKSNWPKIHPGYMLRPNFDDVIDRMRYVADNYEEAHMFAQAQTYQIHQEYDWDTITKRVFENLEERLEFDKAWERGTPVEVTPSRPKVIRTK